MGFVSIIVEPLQNIKVKHPSLDIHDEQYNLSASCINLLCIHSVLKIFIFQVHLNLFLQNGLYKSFVL